jgi:nucleoside 2-deoxyribosyltransferase
MVYLAGPFFSLAERWLVETSRAVLAGLGASVFSPLHDVGVGGDEVAAPDLDGLRRADAVFALLDGWDPGTVYEVGWAHREDLPVVGFQHGVAAVKRTHTRTWKDWRLARRQARAARRRNTIWVACAQWIARTFGELHGNAADVVVRHPVDLSRFDGRRDDVDPRLVLHDARGEHKGERLVAELVRRFPQWKLEPLACAPAEVPERMRRARAFVHLSRYEGNSIVCNEAMAMDLPCMFTRVGLMQDDDGPRDLRLVDPQLAFGDIDGLTSELAAFLASLDAHAYHPRQWVLDHASIELARARWADVVELWRARMADR